MSKPSDERNGHFLDSLWCCKVCDGEIPDGHTDDCDIWKLDKKHRDFLANEYSAALTERDALAAENERLRAVLSWYADESNYGTRVCNDGDGHFDVIEADAEEDRGERARAALAKDPTT